MRRDPSQFAEEVEDKATSSSFSSGLRVGAATKVPIMLWTNPAANFIKQARISFTDLKFAIERDEKESQCPCKRVPFTWPDRQFQVS